MTVFLSKPEGRVILTMRAEGPGAIGDVSQEIHPGESAFGKTYGEWLETPEGAVHVD